MTDITLPRAVVEQALENCRLLAARHRNEDWAKHILRFCEEGEVKAVALREALEQPKKECWCESCDIAANVLRTRMSVCPECGDKRCPRAKHHDSKCQALEQPQQEPEIYQVTAPSNQYRWMAVDAAQYAEYTAHGWIGRKLYTTPPRREWVSLTDAEINDCMSMSIQQTCRTIEAKLKEKNA